MPRSVCALLMMWTFAAFAAGPFDRRPVQIPEEGMERSEDRRTVSAALAVLLGPFGAHRLYFGTNAKVAVIYGLTFGGFGVLPLLDLGHILFTRDLDRYKNNERVFMWSEAPTPP